MMLQTDGKLSEIERDLLIMRERFSWWIVGRRLEHRKFVLECQEHEKAKELLRNYTTYCIKKSDSEESEELKEMWREFAFDTMYL